MALVFWKTLVSDDHGGRRWGWVFHSKGGQLKKKDWERRKPGRQTFCPQPSFPFKEFSSGQWSHSQALATFNFWPESQHFCHFFTGFFFTGPQWWKFTHKRIFRVNVHKYGHFSSAIKEWCPFLNACLPFPANKRSREHKRSVRSSCQLFLLVHLTAQEAVKWNCPL